MTTPTPAKVTFAEPTSSTNHSRPAPKKIKIPSLKDHGPRVLGIVLPPEQMFARLVEMNPELQELVDAHDEWSLAREVNTLIATWCDKLRKKKIWPHAFRILVDHRSQLTCCQALGLAKNSFPENRTAPTLEQIRQIREYLHLPRAEYPLAWCRDQSKS